jgi:hypothetical protein
MLSIFAEFGYEVPTVAYLMNTNWHIATLMDSSAPLVLPSPAPLGIR